MKPTVKFNKNRGFTIIEVLVAIFILGISMLAMLETMVAAIQQNLETYSRDESVRIAEQAMNELRNADFAALANGTYDVTRNYKQMARTFTVNRTVTLISTNSCSVQLQVSWKINNRVRNHSIASIISRGV